MIRVETEVYINKPGEEIFAYISDFENNPKWQAGVIEAQWTSEGPLRFGSTYAQVARFLGRRIESHFEVLEYQPDHLVKATTTSGSFPITFTRMVKSEGKGAQVKAIVEGDASGFFKMAEPLLAVMVRRSVEKDYQNLKRVLEAVEVQE